MNKQYSIDKGKKNQQTNKQFVLIFKRMEFQKFNPASESILYNISTYEFVHMEHQFIIYVLCHVTV